MALVIEVWPGEWSGALPGRMSGFLVRMAEGQSRCGGPELVRAGQWWREWVGYVPSGWVSGVWVWVGPSSASVFETECGISGTLEALFLLTLFLLG